jgi:glutamate/tyrosine decarboxylase-like PLP-dependent enzyme
MRENVASLLAGVQQHASSWFESLDNRPVRATVSADELRQALGGPLPHEGIAPEAVTEILASAGMRGTVASAGPRYFGFVVGGSLPAAVAADWLVSAWDQNTGIYALSPMISVIEQITGSWLRELAGLPATLSFGFVTGGQMANFTGLAASTVVVAHLSQKSRRDDV